MLSIRTTLPKGFIGPITKYIQPSAIQNDVKELNKTSIILRSDD